MGRYFEIILGILVISSSHVWANSECDPAECRQLRERLEKLENVVRSLISIVASQETGEELTEILALSDSLDSSKNSTVPIVEANAEGSKNDVNDLKGAVRCSLANLLDINRSDEINPSGKIKATLGENNLVNIEWTPLSVDCMEFISGVWIRVLESGQQRPSSEDTYLAIPKKCLNQQANASVSIELHSPAVQEITGVDNSCHFELKDVLIQCRVYTIEVVPNYQSLKGKALFTEIVIPPANDNSIDSRETLLSIASNSSSLTLKWKDNSGCAPQLTAFYLEILPDGEEKAGNATTSLRIPRDCLKQTTEETNIFSLSLFEHQTCSEKWVPLDQCRSYKIQIKSQYFNTWTRSPTSWDFFTKEQEFTRTRMRSIQKYNCDSGKFYCEGGCNPYDWICDGEADCRISRIDEQYCDAQCKEGFRCGRQCIPTFLVCDGESDCIDGSDEYDTCGVDYSKNLEIRQESCQQLTNYSGHLSSKRTMHKNMVLITVQNNHTIWLNFNRYVNLHNYVLKVYDGPYLTSPLLLSHDRSTEPPPIRSSSNQLYIEFPSIPNSRTKFEVHIDYTSVDIREPFVPGCGGYIYEKGVVSSPTSLSDFNNVTKCVWFVEAEQSDKGILLKRNRSSNVTTNDEQEQPTMTIYDGWNSTGQVLFDGEVSSSQPTSDILYSINHKMMIRFSRPTVASNSRPIAQWNVITITPHTEIIVGSSGTIKSPNYPASYPNLFDYRWNIVTEPGTKVRLLFAIFETQEMFDSVLVYDGSSVNSRLLLEKSGLAKIPFTITSSSNELLVRFTSDDEITFPGFLAVYSTV